jgi:hypothetical protein
MIGIVVWHALHAIHGKPGVPQWVPRQTPPSLPFGLTPDGPAYLVMMLCAFLPIIPFAVLDRVRFFRERSGHFVGAAVALSLGSLFALSWAWRTPLFTILSSFALILGGGWFLGRRETEWFDTESGAAIFSYRLIAPVGGLWLILLGAAWSRTPNLGMVWAGVLLMLGTAGWLIYSEHQDEVDGLMSEVPPDVGKIVRGLARELHMMVPRVGIHRPRMESAYPWMRIIRLSPFDIDNLSRAELRFHVAQQMAFVRQYRRRVGGTLAGVCVAFAALVSLTLVNPPAWAAVVGLIVGGSVIVLFLQRLMLPYPEQIYEADAAALRVTGDLDAAKGAIRRATLMQWHNAPPISDWIPAHASHRIERLDR